MRHAKEVWSIYIHTKKKLIGPVPEEAYTLDLLDKDFKSTILNVLKELNATMDKKKNKLKESRKMMYRQIEDVNKDKF